MKIISFCRYTGFSVWLHNVSGTKLKTGGEENVLAVFLHSTVYTYELWGYEGAGITRDVTLVLHDAAQSISPWGVVAGASVSGDVTAPSGACGTILVLLYFSYSLQMLTAV